MKTRIISELKNGLCFHLREVTVQERVMTLVEDISVEMQKNYPGSISAFSESHDFSLSLILLCPTHSLIL
jgi:hypothetical protein